MTATRKITRGLVAAALICAIGMMFNSTPVQADGTDTMAALNQAAQNACNISKSLTFNEIRAATNDLLVRYRRLRQPTDTIDQLPDLAQLRDLAFRKKHGLDKHQVRKLRTIVDNVRCSQVRDYESWRSQLATLATALSPRDEHTHQGVRNRLTRFRSLLAYRYDIDHPEDERLRSGFEIELPGRSVSERLTIASYLELEGGTLRILLDHATGIETNPLSADEQAEYQQLRTKAAKTPDALTPVDKIYLSDWAIRTEDVATKEAYTQALVAADRLATRLGRTIRTLTKNEIVTNLGLDTFCALIRGATANQLYGTPPVIPGIIFNEALVQQFGLRSPKVRYFTAAQADHGMTGVEIDTRSNTHPASQAAQHSFDVSDTLGLPVTSVHGHMTFDIDPIMLEDLPEQIAERVDHFRRANLFGELMVAGIAGTLCRKGDAFNLWFDFANAQKLDLLWSHLGRPTWPMNMVDLTSLKMCAVGYRMGIYKPILSHNPNEVTDGYEARLVNRTQAVSNFFALTVPKLAARFKRPASRSNTDGDMSPAIGTWLDAMQRSLVTTDYIIDAGTIAEWAAPYNQPLREFIPGLHYFDPSKDYDRFVNQLPDHIRAVLDPALAEALYAEIGTNYAVGMLVHDWSRDTIWAELSPGLRRKALAKVEAAQLKALRSLAKAAGADALQHNIQSFVLQSGLLEHVARSLDMADIAAIQRHD